MTEVMPKGSSQVWPAILAALAVALAAPASAGQNAPVASSADATRVAVAVPGADGSIQQAAATATEQAAQAAEQAAEPVAEAVPASNFKWNWDNTVTYGIGFRLRDQDARIVGVAAGGKAYSVNGDDGNQNYNTGIFTNAFKWTTEFQFSYKDFGGFFRGFAFYDIENENGDRARTPLSEDTLDRVGKRAEVRDAFVYYRYKAGRLPGEIRVGWQVINWGESTFIQGGINAINPLDVSVVRVPGSELRDALLPVGAVKFSIKPTDSTSFEAFYQYTWEDLKIDPVGSYFSTTDIAGAGAEKVMLGFGSVPDTVPVGHPPIGGSPVGTAVPKRDAVEPSEQGQYGAAIRYLGEGLGGTEFGLYFVNYHSRLPLIMANTGTANGILATGNYAATASYFLTYPEDIQLLGASFNTQLGRSGVALQGEVSHRWRVPLQVDDVELLFAALTPLRLLPAIPQLAPLRGLGGLLAANNQVGAYGFSEQISGYRLFDTTQVQVTGTKAFSRVLWADQMVLVGEVGWGTVHGFPDPSVLRLEGPGTYTSGNAVFTQAGVQPATQLADTFPTENAWGYVLAGRFEYNNAFAAVNAIPRFSFSQDVSGTSPGPGGNFLEGRKAFTAGVGFQYRINWELDVSYTDFFGAEIDGDLAARTAGRYNLINDRDFIAANIKYSF
jgi:hypothetical protein